jgi:hypothetical protein
MAYIDPSILTPGAVGSVPQYPAYTTDTTSQTSSWAPSLPGYEGLASQSSGLAGTMMQGQLPPDVIAEIQQMAAERGLATGGDPTSPNASAAFLRALGLSSLGMQTQGEQMYERLLAGAPRTTTVQGTSNQSNANLIAEANAAPNPYLAALANLNAQNAGALAGQLAAGGTGNTGGGVRVTGGAPAFTGASQPAMFASPNATGASGYGSPYFANTQAGLPASAYTPNLNTGYGALPNMGTVYDESADTSTLFGGVGSGLDIWNLSGVPVSGNYSMPDYSQGTSPANSFLNWSDYWPAVEQPTQGGQDQGGYIDESGDEWVDTGDGYQMNLTTGEYYDPYYGDTFYP